MVRGGGEKATQALKEYGQTVLEADKFKYTERKKEESSFLEAIKTKPEFVISAKAREDQAKALTDFNQRYAPLIKKGYLTMEEKTAMANDRAALEAMQQQQLAHYQQYLGMKEAMLKDTQGRFDRDEFLEWESDYQQTGQFDHATMPLKGVSPSMFLQKNPVPGTETYDAKTSSKLSGTPQEAQRWIREQAYTNEVFRIGLIKEFKTLSPSDKAKYLDADNSGSVSPQEAQAGEGVDVSNPDNPILKYALEKYTDTAIGVKAMKPTKGTSATPKEPTVKASKVGGSWIKMPAGIQTPKLPKKYSDQEYSQTQAFQFGGNAVVYGIRSKGARQLSGTWSTEDEAAGSVDGVIRLYDPIKRVFVVQVSRTSESADAKTSTLLEIPEDNVLEFENIPIEYVGMPMTIGEYKNKYMPQSMGTTLPTTAPTKPKGKLDDL
jgi:hypothetical protein